MILFYQININTIKLIIARNFDQYDHLVYL